MKPGCTCDTCGAFAALEKQCRKHAPTSAPVVNSQGQLTTAGMWPPVQPGQWCREWEAESLNILNS